jgi:hypothetical protein
MTNSKGFMKLFDSFTMGHRQLFFISSIPDMYTSDLLKYRRHSFLITTQHKKV